MMTSLYVVQNLETTLCSYPFNLKPHYNAQCRFPCVPCTSMLHICVVGKVQLDPQRPQHLLVIDEHHPTIVH